MEWMFYGLIEKTEKLMALDFCIDLDCSAASFDSLSAILLTILQTERGMHVADNKSAKQHELGADHKQMTRTAY
ncbi:hypothetical protein B9Z55_026328 [Caenorhabditis nigoni]|uniref:Uncharacterized protein n=1 Tax=Caenorhabditis nigoni TaxID=1611254 RepID=A0A2G5T2P6_9PELO|nr:hypothetical protein B9Z55_026328 [Caenorhabditis nigoni]